MHSTESEWYVIVVVFGDSSQSTLLLQAKYQQHSSTQRSPSVSTTQFHTEKSWCINDTVRHREVLVY